MADVTENPKQQTTRSWHGLERQTCSRPASKQFVIARHRQQPPLRVFFSNFVSNFHFTCLMTKPPIIIWLLFRRSRKLFFLLFRSCYVCRVLTLINFATVCACRANEIEILELAEELTGGRLNALLDLCGFSGGDFAAVRKSLAERDNRRSKNLQTIQSRCISCTFQDRIDFRWFLTRTSKVGGLSEAGWRCWSDLIEMRARMLLEMISTSYFVIKDSWNWFLRCSREFLWWISFKKTFLESEKEIWKQKFCIRQKN